MDYELLYTKLIKKIELGIKECENLISNPQVAQENKPKYLMAKVYLSLIHEQAGKDVLEQIIK